MSEKEVVVNVQGLRKYYRNIKAVDGIDFEIREGEIFGIVGPNGAGKTTTVECIEGLRVPDAGKISVLNLDPQKDKNQLKRQIGIQLQEGRLPDRLKVREALDLFDSFYGIPSNHNKILDELGLSEKADSYYENLSGGQKQRLVVALSLLGSPKIVFFDELSTGLDPQARRSIWDTVRSIRNSGKTVVLVTHFMDEAEFLCDRVAVIDYGKLLALDSPSNLIKSVFKSAMKISFTSEQEFDYAQMINDKLGQVQRDGNTITVYCASDAYIVDIVSFLVNSGIKFSHISVDKLSLEDVFLSLTGRKVRE